MSWTQKHLDALEQAIAEGARVVRYNNKEVTYRTLDEMIRIRDMMRRDLGLVETNTRLLAGFSKGTD